MRLTLENLQTIANNVNGELTFHKAVVFNPEDIYYIDVAVVKWKAAFFNGISVQQVENSSIYCKVCESSHNTPFYIPYQPYDNIHFFPESFELKNETVDETTEVIMYRNPYDKEKDGSWTDYLSFTVKRPEKIEEPQVTDNVVLFKPKK